MLTRHLFVQHPAAGAVGVQAGYQQVHPVDHIVVCDFLQSVVQAETVGNGPDAVHVEVVPGTDGTVQAQFDRGAHYEINILTCLVAKKMGVQHTIARIRSPEYGRQLRFMRSELGLSMAINPEAATAREIARVLRFPTAMKLESFSKGRLELVEYRVAEHTALDGTRLSELYRNFSGFWAYSGPGPLRS